ncbi:MAG: EutN/CcmL family microcompartment protein [Planctomycetes bacterium]|nr:EutN/CcmL family microcompartment protein [Planctomycetota bacterium]
MLLGKVTGTVVASAKDERLKHFKMLVVETLKPNGKPASGYVVAVDAVGAGAGEVVLYVTGSSARQTVLTDKRPTDAAIVAIVDTVEVNDRVTYQK